MAVRVTKLLVSLSVFLCSPPPLVQQECARTSSPPKSVLLLTERNSRHVTGVLRYLRRTGAVLPPELLHFARGVGQAKELQRAGRPLCSYLKSLGFCR